MDSKVRERVVALYDAGRVKRLHTVPTLVECTVGQHVYGSLVLAVELAILNPDARLEAVMRALLYHDAAELHTGDVPAPTKRANRTLAMELETMELDWNYDMRLPMPADLTVLEVLMVKACDVLDLAYTAIHESIMGNAHPRLQTVYYNCVTYLSEKEMAQVEGIRFFTDHIKDLWSDYNG